MTQNKINPFPNPDRKRLLITLLKVMGGHKVEVSFSGGGDDGSIESAVLLDSEGKEISLKNTEFEWETEHSNYERKENSEEGEWVKTSEIKAMPVDDILVKICEDCLGSTGMDWYNNEGGQGSLEIDLNTDPASVVLNIGINHTHTEDYAFDFNEEEEKEDKDASTSS